MKDYQRRLLNHLQSDNSVSNKDPLQDVKNAMGEIAFVSGNPLTKTEITLNITTTFVINGGLIVIPPAALPPVLQTQVPVFLFGLTDYYAGFKRMFNVIPLINPWIVQFPGAIGVPPVGIFGFNMQYSLNPNIQLGDLVIWLNSPVGFSCEIDIHCDNVAYGTFLNSFVSDLITIDTIRYIVPIAFINQFINPLKFGYQNLFGKLFVDSVDPRMYITSADFQQQIADIPINLPIDKAVMLGTYLNYDCQNVSMILFVKKVEALTHKQNLNKLK
jgi:hypothetical protein